MNEINIDIQNEPKVRPDKEKVGLLILKIIGFIVFAPIAIILWIIIQGVKNAK